MCFGGRKTRLSSETCDRGLRQRPLARSFHPQLWLVHLKFYLALKFNSRSRSRSNSNRFSGLCRMWQKRMRRRKPAEVSLLSFHFASSWGTSASRERNLTRCLLLDCWFREEVYHDSTEPISRKRLFALQWSYNSWQSWRSQNGRYGCTIHSERHEQ